VSGRLQPGTAPRRFAVGAVIIDLDGTLLDTVPDLAEAVNLAFRDLGRTALQQQQIAQYVGKGVEVLMHRALTGHLDGRVAEAQFRPAIDAFMMHYTQVNGRHSRVYPGVLEGLEAMSAMGLRLAVVTNKPLSFTEPLLQATGLRKFFELVVGGDSLSRKKPDPLPMTHVSRQFGLPANQILAIGDSLNDALAARAAGMPVLAVPYGYNEGADVNSLDVDAIVTTLSEAGTLIDPIRS